MQQTDGLNGTQGGFDIVIGNPPYGATLSDENIKYCKDNYTLKTTETAILFIEKGIRLCKKDAVKTYIIPKSFLYSSDYEKTRDFVKKELSLIVDCGKIFEKVLFEACVILNKKEEKLDYYKSVLFNSNQFEVIGIINKELKSKFGIYLNCVTRNEIIIGEKIAENNIFLNDISHNSRGEAFQEFVKSSGKYKVIGGKQIDKYKIKEIKGYLSDEKLLTDKAKVNINGVLVQNIVAHIMKPHEHIKIIAYIPDEHDYLILDTINQINISNKNYNKKFIWALLNSNLINWYAYRFIFAKARRTMHFDNIVTLRIPIPSISAEQQPIINEIIEKVNKIFSAKRKNALIDTSDLEKQIGELIYKLYGLTEKEIAIIEQR
jgi:hypothetical protein